MSECGGREPVALKKSCSRVSVGYNKNGQDSKEHGERLTVAPQRLQSRFFAAAAYGGKLYVRGMLPGAAWDRNRLEYRIEEEINALKERMDDRMALTSGELNAFTRGLGAGPSRRMIWLWIHEDLEEEVRHLWEHGQMAGLSNRAADIQKKTPSVETQPRSVRVGSGSSRP
jgi:hypothetical protein